MTKFDKVIPPGSEGKIYASIDTSHAEGAIQKFIDIKSNDPAHPVLRVSVKAVVKSLVKLDPEYLRFNVLKGSLESGDLFLKPEPSVKLLKPVIDSDLVKAELDPNKDKAGRQRLTVSLARTDVIGMHTVEINIPAQGPLKEVKVPVVIVVRGPLEATPSVVSFQVNSFPDVVQATAPITLKKEPSAMGQAVAKIAAGRQFQVMSEAEGWYQVIVLEQPNAKTAAGDNEIGWIQNAGLKAVKPPEFPGPQKVQIQSSLGKHFVVLGLRSTLPSVKLEQKSGTQVGNQFEFAATLQKMEGAKKGHQQGEILIQTDNPDQPQVRIPLYVNYM